MEQHQRLELAKTILDQVVDPEIPVLTIGDLGLLRSLSFKDTDTLEVVITPTYSGCPAMDMIQVNIRAALQQAGFEKIDIKTVLSPPWTTDWIRPEALEKLRAYGIAPPIEASANIRALTGEQKLVACPQCGSNHTELISAFGSTACKALFRCKDCLEPFDYFKCH
jgi:ring-1,2-phenylacetyl-CoA epoxidase subunit PaaD